MKKLLLALMIPSCVLITACNPEYLSRSQPATEGLCKITVEEPKSNPRNSAEIVASAKRYPTKGKSCRPHRFTVQLKKEQLGPDKTVSEKSVDYPQGGEVLLAARCDKEGPGKYYVFATDWNKSTERESNAVQLCDNKQ